MSGPDAALAARARRAYEIGRLEAALRRGLLLAPLVGAALLCCADAAGVLAGGAGLLAAVTYCLWRGEAFGRGVRPGLIAGMVPLVLPLAVQAMGHPCDPYRCLLDASICVIAGVAGGIALGLAAPRPREAGGIPLFVAGLIAGLTGSMGCILYGLIGLGGMVLGLLGGAAPFLAVRHARG
ncbi:MAG: hypothetical protein ACRD5D_00635 [Candidatus Polarisedimenticolia bacterium]